MTEALPDLSELTRILNLVLRDVDPRGGVTVSGREANVRTSTFPSEIITCQIGDDRTLRLHTKCSADVDNSSFRHRSGVDYEASVYRRVLDPLDLDVPAYYGRYRDPATGWTWLVIEHLEDAVIVSKSAASESMLEKAAEWAGRFHSFHDSCPRNPHASFLKVYDRSYYRGWCDRTLTAAREAGADLPWLEALGRRFDEVLALLLESGQTVLHGEFCPKNILVSGDRVFPVDWESAAWGLGEIDLISLTDGWADDVLRNCEQSYSLARWPGGPPSDLPRILEAARIYWNLRWLGEGRRSFERKSARLHLAEIHGACERLGID